MVFDYDREHFRNFSTYIEVDYAGVDPRELYRNHKRDVQEIVMDDAYRYSLTPASDSMVAISPHPIGDQTGLVEGKLVAETDWTVFHSDSRTTESDSNMLAILLGVVGIIALIAALGVRGGGGIALGLVGLGAIAGAVAAYYRTTEYTRGTAYEYSRRIEVLIQGEVSEQVHTTGETKSADMLADVSAVYGEQTRVRTVGSGNRIAAAELSEELQTELEKDGSSVIKHLIDQELDPTMYVNRKHVEELTDEEDVAANAEENGESAAEVEEAESS